MPIAPPRRFRYIADPLCLSAAVLYILNRWLLKPHDMGGMLSRDYLNDLLCLPLFLPLSLGLQRLLRIRKSDAPPRLWEVVQHGAVFAIVFELLIPRLPDHFRSTADPLDAVAYLAGGLAAWFWWRERGNTSKLKIRSTPGR